MPDSENTRGTMEYTYEKNGEDGYKITTRGRRGGQHVRGVSYSWSIPVPFMKQRLAPDEHGNTLYQGEGELSSQARAHTSNYVISLTLLFLPAIVYVVSFGHYTHPFLWLGTLAGTFLTVTSLKNTFALNKFGATRLKLDAPPVVGKPLAGRIAFKKRLPESQAVELKLVCYEGVERNTGFDSSTDYVVYWFGEHYTRVQNDHGKSAFSFEFDVPADLPPHDHVTFRWSLELRGVINKKGLTRTWSIPMELPATENGASTSR